MPLSEREARQIERRLAESANNAEEARSQARKADRQTALVTARLRDHEQRLMVLERAGALARDGLVTEASRPSGRIAVEVRGVGETGDPELQLIEGADEDDPMVRVPQRVRASRALALLNVALERYREERRRPAPAPAPSPTPSPAPAPAAAADPEVSRGRGRS